MKYIIYASKSTEEKDRQILNIEAQLKFWGLGVAACSGEMRSNYFQDSALKFDFRMW